MVFVMYRSGVLSLAEKRSDVMAKRLSVSEKYRQLKRQTEAAGMKVTEKNGKLVVTRKRK